jgi:hypothetical protein
VVSVDALAASPPGTSPARLSSGRRGYVDTEYSRRKATVAYEGTFDMQKFPSSRKISARAYILRSEIRLLGMRDWRFDSGIVFMSVFGANKF